MCHWDRPQQAGVQGRTLGPVSIWNVEQEGARVGHPAEGRLHPAQPPVPRASGGFQQNKSQTPLPRGEVSNVLQNGDEGAERGPVNPTLPKQNQPPQGLGRMTSHIESLAPCT